MSNPLPWDKEEHLMAGAVACVFALFVSYVLGYEALWVGPVVASIVGALKELSDYILNRREAAAGQPPTHDPDVYDWLATTCGGLVAALLWAGLAQIV